MKNLAWYIDLNGIGTKNTIKYPILYWYQNVCNPHYRDPNGIEKKDNTSILCHQIVISSSNAIVVTLMLCSMKLPDYAMKRQECPHTHR